MQYSRRWNEVSNVINSRMRGGCVIEVLLSEHMGQGFIQGYTLTGRVGIFERFSWYHKMMMQLEKPSDTVRASVMSQRSFIHTAGCQYISDNHTPLLEIEKLSNLVVGSKQLTLSHVTPEEAEDHCREGAVLHSCNCGTLMRASDGTVRQRSQVTDLTPDKAGANPRSYSIFDQGIW
ncbi:hypothetical protein N7493_004809 [Penicillium malachiteum]|uniref:Uncharacterized protein n=1 Tax=Penicillium malachiteum TaxID=1324776 RepID=A0AAD6HPX9_9EURO|nr:hypothetical protein N7493_004809 [Penicillium malachiteum]